MKKINAMCVVMGEETYGPFIKQATTFVKEMQTILKARTTRNANAKAKEEAEGGSEAADGDAAEKVES